VDRLREVLWDDALSRLGARLQSFFVPTVSAVAVADLVGLPDAGGAVKQLYDWERDRLFTLAKGLGGAAVAVLTTLLVETAKGTHTTASGDWLASVCVVLLLLWAAFILSGLRRLAEEYPIAFTLVTGQSALLFGDGSP
jgi:hypothetical protein